MSLLPERHLCLWITTTTVTTCQIIYQIIMAIMGIELFSHVKTFFCFKNLHICGTCQWKWFVLNCLQETLQDIWSRTEKPSPEDASQEDVKLINPEHLKNFRNVDCVLANHNKV